MNKTIGFIGGGNMASAIIGGILKANLAQKEQVMASCKSEESVKRLREMFGIAATTDNKTVATKSDILFLAVKPNMFATVIPEIRDCTKAIRLLSRSLQDRQSRPSRRLLERTSNWCVRCPTHRHLLVRR